MGRSRQNGLTIRVTGRRGPRRNTLEEPCPRTATIRSTCSRIRGQSWSWARDDGEPASRGRFCWYLRFRSVVTNTSEAPQTPPSQSVHHCAVVTNPFVGCRLHSVCRKAWRSGTGVPWSNWDLHSGHFERSAACSEDRLSPDPPRRRGTTKEILSVASSSRFSEQGRHGYPRARKHPGPLTREGSRSTTGQEDQSIIEPSLALAPGSVTIASHPRKVHAAASRQERLQRRVELRRPLEVGRMPRPRRWRATCTPGTAAAMASMANGGITMMSSCPTMNSTGQRTRARSDGGRWRPGTAGPSTPACPSSRRRCRRHGGTQQVQCRLLARHALAGRPGGCRAGTPAMAAAWDWVHQAATRPAIARATYRVQRAGGVHITRPRTRSGWRSANSSAVQPPHGLADQPDTLQRRSSSSRRAGRRDSRPDRPIGQARRGREPRCAQATQVWRGAVRHLPPPRQMVAAQAVQEHDRARRAVAAELVVDAAVGALGQPLRRGGGAAARAAWGWESGGHEGPGYVRGRGRGPPWG